MTELMVKQEEIKTLPFGDVWAEYCEEFGLMHTVEKSAEILVKMLSMRPDKRQTISPQNFRDLAKDFKVTLPEKFLYDK